MDDVNNPDPTLDLAAARALAEGRNGDPFALLGPHGSMVRVFLPGAVAVSAVDFENGKALSDFHATGISGLYVASLAKNTRYRLEIDWGGTVQVTEDPYAYGLLLGEMDLHLIGEGTHRELGSALGAQAMTLGDTAGVRFSVWAPNARRVSVVGDFNSWDGRRNPMRNRGGVWELFLPRVAPGAVYKYEILGPHGLLPLKADPLALQAEVAPATGSVVADPQPYEWNDQTWMRTRRARQSLHAPMSIYEVHAGSWRSDAKTWDALADTLIPYVRDLGFTHIELLPVMTHPFGGSWGYQPLGLFAPQASFGDPDSFRRFIDRCHGENLGVILDWVPAHFPNDQHGLALFDGTPLYEHADPREGFHKDWNTLIYNHGRNEVRGFLIGSALHWLEHYHADGLRVDAVASMLYRDYSREPGQWVPNKHGGRENLEAIGFLQQLNTLVDERAPGALMIAEESTAWPGVTKPAREHGLGFSYKWNMGWMHDSLEYIQKDPVYRRHEHNKLTFGLAYAFSEHFVLPISHDEVVHGKGSLIGKMPGDEWQRHANLRAYLAFMWAHPGKKLLYMGCEFAQRREWNHDAELDWSALGDPRKAGVQRLLRDLNRLYAEQPALHQLDCDAAGFRWLIGDDASNSVFAWYRAGAPEHAPVLAVCNFTPVPRQDYRIGVPRAGRWRELLNTDAADYGGSNIGNAGAVEAQPLPAHGQPYSLALTLPPLAVLLLGCEDCD